VPGGPAYSSRLRFTTEPNALTALLEARRRAGASILDLTVSNPTLAEIPYPSEDIRTALADPGLLRYEPTPRGLASARAAVAAEAGVAPDDVLLTASTSESYAYLFKLLCDPGDSVLAPEPSYPLFSYLTALEGVELVPYPLVFDGAWHIDLAALEAARGPRTRAILVVSPNNPTGSYLKVDELRRLETLGLPLIVDEVFAGYPAIDDPGRVVGAARAAEAGLVFSLGGLSKSAGLPQLKLGWIVGGGPGRAAALERLDLIADSYLSVATPVMLALPRLLDLGAEVRARIQERVARNRAALAARLPPSTTLLPSEGGWSAVLRFPATRTDEEMALTLLGEHDTLVQPGYFFDFPRGTFIVVSLLPPPACFDAGIEAMLKLCERAGRP
jgi:aspartate/methionine/tyrosine aminotransferase